MKDCTIRTGTISISDLPFLKDYEEVKKRLSIRLVNRMKIKPEAVYKLYLDFGVTCHIDVSDLVGNDATCMVKRGLLENIGVEKDRLFADAVENNMKITATDPQADDGYLQGVWRDQERGSGWS